MAYQDARKDYLTKCAVEALGATTPSNQWATSPESMYSAVHGASAMQDFLENGDIRTLQVCTTSTSSGASELMCTTSVGLQSSGGGISRSSRCRWQAVWQLRPRKSKGAA